MGLRLLVSGVCGSHGRTAVRLTVSGKRLAAPTAPAVPSALFPQHHPVGPCGEELAGAPDCVYELSGLDCSERGPKAKTGFLRAF